VSLGTDAVRTRGDSRGPGTGGCFRWSFDRETGDLWIGDVGQGAREEVDFEPADAPGGRNYGWDVMETSLCNGVDPAVAPPCHAPALTLPIHEYGRSAGDCSIIGGNVFRSGSTPLTGLYFFGDSCTGNVWSLDPATLEVVSRTRELAPAPGAAFSLASFGGDGSGGLLLVQPEQGAVYRIVSAEPACGDGVDNDGDGLADFPVDPGCSSPVATPENPACNDGVDNDGDDRVDWDGGGSVTADPQCAQASVGTEEPIRCGFDSEFALVGGAAWLRLRRRRHEV